MPNTTETPDNRAISARFRRFLPVIVDVETGGFNEKTDALLEIAAVAVQMDAEGELSPGEKFADHVLPFEGARCEEAALKVNGIDPFHPLRAARDEKDVLRDFFDAVGKWTAKQGCTRAIMVGHNTFFDHKFISEAARRCDVGPSPFHSFSTLDTVTLGACLYGETVLAKVAVAAGLDWQESEAHSAIYDADITAQIFCDACNLGFRKKA